MDAKTVLVTGIGGNVGQGILRNIRALDFNIKIIGCDISSFTAGNHLCDKVCQVPYSYEDNYIDRIIEITNKYEIHLIIPSTDYEIYYLGLHRDKLEAKVLASDSDMSKQFLDKYLTYQLFKENRIPFAKSWLPNEYDFSESKIIAKPREGRGSRGIVVNPLSISSFGEDYMIQKLHKGIEITTAVYVAKSNEIHGICSMERKLENGTTSQVILNNSYDKNLMVIAQKIVGLGGIVGSFNIQSIIDKDGCVHPFEVNCRISGTNSIRHCMGFQDVKYGLQEHLYNKTPSPIKIVNSKAIAVRIFMDVIYPEATSFDDISNNPSTHFIY